MKQKMTRKQKFLWFLTKHMKPCYFFHVAKTPKRDYVDCRAYKGYRKKCGTWQCPYFIPTGWYKLARFLGMVKH